MKALITFTILFLVIAGAIGFALRTTDPGEVIVETERVAVDDEVHEEVVVEVEQVPTGMQTYRNDEWGFAFEYPEGWEFKENTFSGYSSLFNIVLQSIEPRAPSWPITIMVSFDDWAQRVIAGVQNRGGIIETTTIQGYPALYFETEEMGVPATAYLIQIDEERWFIVTGKTDPEYDEVLENILLSLEFYDSVD